MAPDEIRSCVIVVTVWVDDADTRDLRARFAVSVSRGEREDRESFAAHGIDDACVRLRAWLERFAGDQCDPTTTKPNESALP